MSASSAPYLQVHQTIVRDRGMSSVSMPTESSIVPTGPERKLAFYGETWEWNPEKFGVQSCLTYSLEPVKIMWLWASHWRLLNLCTMEIWICYWRVLKDLGIVILNIEINKERLVMPLECHPLWQFCLSKVPSWITLRRGLSVQTFPAAQSPGHFKNCGLIYLQACTQRKLLLVYFSLFSFLLPTPPPCSTCYSLRVAKFSK